MFKLDKHLIDDVLYGFGVPSKPQALTDLEDIKQYHEANIRMAADVIMSDVNLSGLVLKAINSSFFGLQEKVTDIKKATIALGFDNIYNMTMTGLLREAFSGKACISLERFWDESIETAKLCAYIASQSNSAATEASAYTLGILHHCGVASMAMRFDDYIEVLSEHNAAAGIDLSKLELKRYNISHSIVGCVIAMSWNLPEHHCHLISIHHDRDAINELIHDEKIHLAACLDLATIITEHQRNHRKLDNEEEILSWALKALKMTEEKFAELQQKIDSR